MVSFAEFKTIVVSVVYQNPLACNILRNCSFDLECLVRRTIHGKGAYSVNDKLTVIERVRKGESQAKLSRELNVAESTIRSWLKDENKLREFVHTVDEDDGLLRKRAHKADLDDLDEAIYKWFVQQQQSGVLAQLSVLKLRSLIDNCKMFSQLLRNPVVGYGVSKCNMA